jgi:hypothetical protein
MEQCEFRNQIAAFDPSSPQIVEAFLTLFKQIAIISA